jgi:cation diffusion facilitator family transporter
MSKTGTNTIIIATWVSVVGNAVLSVLKLLAGFVSGSFAVVADGIDSAIDIVSSVIALIAARVVLRPPNIRFPYGYIKADTIATKVLSLIIIVAGFQLLIASAGNFLHPDDSRQLPGFISIYVTVFSIVVKFILSVYLGKTGRKKSSQMLSTMGMHMRSDMLISFSVLISLILTYALKAPMVDSVVALIISLYIIYTAFRIFLRSNTALMDGIDDAELYQKVFDAVNSVEGAQHPHRARARKIGTYYMINLDVEVDPELSVREAHDIAKKVEKRIKENVERVYDVMVHIEPRGNVEKDEKFGVSEKDMY